MKNNLAYRLGQMFAAVVALSAMGVVIAAAIRLIGWILF